MIVSHYLSEPSHDPSVSGSDPRRLVGPPFRAAREYLTQLLAGRSAMRRLDFWTINPLAHRLAWYTPKEPNVGTWRGYPWQTLVWWMELTPGHIPRWPEPEAPKAIRYIPEYEMSR